MLKENSRSQQRRIRLGFVSAILPKKSLEEIFEVANDLGYQSVEVMCWPSKEKIEEYEKKIGAGIKDTRKFAGACHVDVDPFDVSKVRDAVEGYGIAISGLGYYPNPLDPDPKVSRFFVGHLRKVIDAAAILGVPVNTFIGRDPNLSVDDNWRRMRKTWKPIMTYAEDRGVRVGIENCPMLFTQDEWPGGKNLATTPEIWDRLFDDFHSHNLGLNYDPSHFVLQFMDPISPIPKYGKRFFHVHAKDLRIDKERLNSVGSLACPLKYCTPVVPGFGDVPWDKFFDALYNVGYAGDVAVEIEDKRFEDRPLDALNIAKQNLDRFVA